MQCALLGSIAYSPDDHEEAEEQETPLSALSPTTAAARDYHELAKAVRRAARRLEVSADSTLRFRRFAEIIGRKPSIDD